MRYLLFFILLLPSALNAEEAMTAKALQTLCPGASWVLSGDSYDGIDWQDTTIPEPTRQQVAAAVQVQIILDERAAEYPTLREKVDALIAGGQTLSDLKKRIKDIDDKYPLPGK